MAVWVGIGNIGTGYLKEAAYALLGISGKLSRTQIRNGVMNTATPISVTDLPDGTIAVFVPGDNTSLDNGSTMLVDSAGNRFRITTVQNFITQSPYA